MTGINQENLRATLRSEVQKCAVELLRPDGAPYLALGYSDEVKISKACGCSLKDVQLAALLCDVIPTRYIRNQKTFSNQDQIKLLKSHVAIVGLGGLGGYVLESLARVGVGRLTLIDGDSFDETNLNRQLLSSVESIGLMKAEVAASRVRAINPALETYVKAEYLTAENNKKLLSDANIVIDCLDNISSRFEVEDAAKSLGIPMVFAAIGGTAGQMMVIHPEDEGLVKIYGDRKKTPKRGSEISTGTIAFAAMATAAHECAEVVSLILSGASNFRDTLLFTDMTDHSIEKIKMS